MQLGGVSHLAIGVRDMDRSITFYRDRLDMVVLSDRELPVSGSALHADPGEATSRRLAKLGWLDGDDAPFLVLSSFPVDRGEPLRLDQVGLHHVALWVSDLAAMAAGLADAGVEFLMEPTEVDARGYGGEKGQKVLTCLIADPDGTILQFDERL